MSYGICALSIVPLRSAAQEDASIISEILYGEIFTIIETQSQWISVQLADGSQGWIDSVQCQKISATDYEKLSKTPPKVAADLVEFICKNEAILFPISV